MKTITVDAERLEEFLAWVAALPVGNLKPTLAEWREYLGLPERKARREREG